MTVRNRIVKAEKIDSSVISEEITEAVISVEALEAGHVTEEWTPEERTLEEEDPVLDLESENPAIIGKGLDHVIVKKDKDLDQEKAGNPIIFGGRDLQGGTGSRGDQDQLNVIETVGNEPRTGELVPWSNLHKTSVVFLYLICYFDLLLFDKFFGEKKIKLKEASWIFLL